MGLGNVGGGVASALTGDPSPVPKLAECGVVLKGVLVRDASRPRSPEALGPLLTSEPEVLLDDPGVHLVVELIGGENPAYDYIRRALDSGRHVITANKEVMAKHGSELTTLASKKGVHLLFEASVGGGIPIIGPLTKDLLANRIGSITAIINGTTNYILSNMANGGVSFHDALKEAQRLGYAEADPSSDIEGDDAAYKLAVLSSLAFHTSVHSDDVYREGISRLEARDFRYAQELGYAIKLLAIAQDDGDAVQVRTHPALVPLTHMLAKVDGVFNAIEVKGDLVGRVLFHGRGAGREPTTSAVVGDIVEAARRIRSGSPPQPRPVTEAKPITPMSSLVSKYYVRINVADQAGVLAHIARILGDHDISIANVLQKDADPATQTAELVVTTHPSSERSMQKSLTLIRGVNTVREINNLIRILDWDDE